MSRTPQDWQRLSAGAGTGGPRVHEWCDVALADLSAEEYGGKPDALWTRGLLILSQALEAEATEAMGASKSERSGARIGYRAGYYSRTLVTRVGKIELRVPQDRDGRFSTELFERY